MAQNPATLRGADTVQVHQDVEPLVGGFPVFPITFHDILGTAPPWKQGDRDGWLRNFWRDFGNDMLQAVLAVSIAKVETQNWEMEGPEALADMYHDIVRDEADFGAGYGSLVARGVMDYYTQDNGWFLERLRSGPKDHDGPMLGIAHIDSARMRSTGNAEFPWTYLDVQGEYHLMHRSQVIRIVDMPDSATTLYSPQRGFCALSRALSTAMILTMLVTLKREKLADLPPSALAIFNNINRKQFEKALSLHGAQTDQIGNQIWRQLLPLFGIDPARTASVQFISLREVWEGFDDMTAMNIAAYSFAAAWRIDPREFWPVSQGPLGTGKEAEVQHQKAKSKSTGLLFTEVERAFNHKYSLPEGLAFKFKIQDIDEEEQKAGIHKTQIDNVKVMQDAGAALTAEEVRYLFAVQYKVIPQTMMAVPEEGQPSGLAHSDVVMDDVERQAKAYGGWYFGRRVRIDSYGVKEYTDFVDMAVAQAYKEILPSDVFYVGSKALTALPIARDGVATLSSEGTIEPTSRTTLEVALKEEFACCPDHAFSMFPDVLDQLVELGQITKEQAQIVYQAPTDILNIIQASVKEAVLTGQDVVNTVARSVNTASLTPYDVGEKEDSALTLINRKIASLDSTTASFVRAESRALRDTFLSGNHYRKLVDIPDAVWDEAMRLDVLDEQLEDDDGVT